MLKHREEVFDIGASMCSSWLQISASSMCFISIDFEECSGGF